MMSFRLIAFGFQAVVLLSMAVLLSGIGESLANGTNFQYQEIHSFSDVEVGDPRGELYESTDGYFYAVSGHRSSTDRSTVYRIHKDGSGYQALHAFPDDVTCNAIMEASDGKLYGGEFMYLRNRPHTLFRMNKDGSDFVVLHSFPTNGSDGLEIVGRLTEGPDRMLYGATAGNGFLLGGAVFRIGRDGNSFQILRQFGSNPANGIGPAGPLLVSADGFIYGVTSDRPTDDSNRGTIFRLSTNGTDFLTLKTFGNTRADGWWPQGGLVEDRDGTLYGATSGGGYRQAGVIFQMQKNGSNYTAIHEFQGDEETGDGPFGNLVLGSDGFIYGTTQDGGRLGAGTIYRVRKNGEGFEILRIYVDLVEAHTGTPGGPLTRSSKGALYGVAVAGGEFGRGSIFRFAQESKLTISRHNGEATITWPGLYEGYELQETMELGLSWSPSATNQTDRLGTTEATLPLIGPSRFFRLFPR